MIFIKKFNKVFRDAMHKMMFRRKLRQMDKRWYFIGANSWELFPPSFYYAHTQEEVERIAAETIEEIEELIKKLKKK